MLSVIYSTIAVIPCITKRTLTSATHRMSVLEVRLHGTFFIDIIRFVERNNDSHQIEISIYNIARCLRVPRV